MTALFYKNSNITILTSRSNDSTVINETLDFLKSLNIKFHNYYFLPDINQQTHLTPPPELDWYLKQIWQKADYCQKNSIDVIFEDCPKTIALIKRYSPRTQIFQVINNKS